MRPTNGHLTEPAVRIAGVDPPRPSETVLIERRPLTCEVCGCLRSAHPVDCARHPWLLWHRDVHPLYRIESLADFAKVPSDRLPACLAAFAAWVATCRDVVAREGAERTGRAIVAPGLPPLKLVWTWIDGGEGETGP